MKTQRARDNAEGVRKFQPRVAATLGTYSAKNRNAESVGYVCRSLRELLQSSQVANIKLETQGCRNPGLELANAFSVLPGTTDVMAASGVFTQPL